MQRRNCSAELVTFPGMNTLLLSSMRSVYGRSKQRVGRNSDGDMSADRILRSLDLPESYEYINSCSKKVL